MTCVEPETGVWGTGVGVGGTAVGVGAGVSTTVAGVEAGLALAVLPPPQAASSTSIATKANSKGNLLEARRAYMFLSIIFSLS